MTLLVSDSQQVQFARGFKTWSENVAITLRNNIGIHKTAPLSPELLADYIGVRIWSLSEVPNLPADTLAYLSSPKADDWSAVTVRVGLHEVIVLNTTHSQARQASDLMHELSHIIRKHEPSQIIVSEQTGIGLRTFSTIQENEANWLAGCLLLPRLALVSCKERRLKDVDILSQYNVSKELLNYRLNVTGVRRQYGRQPI